MQFLPVWPSRSVNFPWPWSLVCFSFFSSGLVQYHYVDFEAHFFSLWRQFFPVTIKSFDGYVCLPKFRPVVKFWCALLSAFSWLGNFTAHEILIKFDMLLPKGTYCLGSVSMLYFRAVIWFNTAVSWLHVTRKMTDCIWWKEVSFWIFAQVFSVTPFTARCFSFKLVIVVLFPVWIFSNVGLMILSLHWQNAVSAIVPSSSSN